MLSVCRAARHNCAWPLGGRPSFVGDVEAILDFFRQWENVNLLYGRLSLWAFR